MPEIITLTTDFGLQDYYVGAMKAVMLEIASNVTFVDISHEIPPQDIMAGSWVLRNSAHLFPEGTVHLVVIDPGVGTHRNPVAVRIGNQYFVGPDNGLFSLLSDQEFEAVRLTNEALWRKPRSVTFHGRDIFAPVAAHLSLGVPFEELGEPLDNLVTYRWAEPIADPDGIQGWIIHIDRFGNLISNLTQPLINEVLQGRPVKLYVGNTIIDGISETFGSVPEGEPVAYIGSSGMLEIGINKGNAQVMLGARKGTQISLVPRKDL